MDSKKTGQAIAFLRKLKKYTQKELAKMLGVSDKAVSKWERGLGVPDVSLLARLSIILDTDIESLLEGNVSHYKQSWCGVLLLDESESGEIYAGTQIYDKPIVYFLLSYFMLVGIKDILVLCNSRSMKFISQEIGDGSIYGIHIQCVNFGDVEEHGFYSTVIEFALGRHLAIIKGYELFYGLDLTKYMQRAMSKENEASVFALTYPLDENVNYVQYDANRKCLSRSKYEEFDAVDKYYEAPVLFCTTEAMSNIPSKPKNFAHLLLELRESNKLYVELIGRGMIGIKLKNYEDVSMASQLVRMVQITQQVQLASLEEIAWRRGLIRR